MKTCQIADEQLRLLKLAKVYLRASESSGMNVDSSDFFYLNSWSPCIGNAILRSWRSGFHSSIFFLKQYLKSIIYIGMQSKYQMLGMNNDGEIFENVVISWAKQSDFSDSGHYSDRYLQSRSDEAASTLWILILTEGQKPLILDKNIRLILRSSGAFNFDFIFWIKILFEKIIKSKGSPKLFVLSFLSASVFSEQISKLVSIELKDKKVSKLLMPYEAQPFQNHCITSLKKIDPKIISIGYLHSALPALPTDMIYRMGAPDILWVHGRGQGKILHEYLDWPLDAIREIPSLRYREGNSLLFSGKIYLPYSIIKLSAIVSQISSYLNMAESESLPYLEIKNHPMMHSSKTHLSAVRKLEDLISIYSSKFSDKTSVTNLAVFIGVTAAIIESLEMGVTTVQICSDPIFDSHSEIIWESLLVSKITTNIFQYKLLNKGDYINYGKNENMLSLYL
jgi:hypothetical protein